MEIVDLHAHVLAGLDDGPRTPSDATAVLEALRADGVARVVATPHVNSRFPNTAASVREALASAAPAPPGIEVLAGAEVHPERLDAALDEGPQAYALGSSPWLLLEVYPGLAIDLLELAVRRLERAGMRTLLAHPERCSAVQRHPDGLDNLIAAGVAVQVTARSLVGDARPSQRLAWHLLERGNVHVVASDVHNLAGLASSLSVAGEALRQRAGDEVAELLLSTNPAALLAGGEPSRPPQAPSGRRRWGWRR